MADPAPVGALIDFPLHPGKAGSPRLRLAFGEPARWLIAESLTDVPAVIDAAHAQARAGAWCLGGVAYEAAPAFDAAMPVRAPDTRLPLAAFAVFDAPPRVWPADDDGTAWQCDAWQDRLASADFERDVERIHEAIRNGEVYQVNYTTRLRGALHGAPVPWFRALHRGQPGGYALLLRGPQSASRAPWVLASVSPELFFDWRDARLTAQPMKGTAPRGRTAKEDEAAAAHLRDSDKERAENLMIVDLLRNDFARVARIGSVAVPRLFELHELPTVWQMTSTITATTREGLALSDIFAALFPCGSVTGAPKIQAMKTIAALETDARGLYCGAVGVIAPGGAATFNVPIRTVVCHREPEPAGSDTGDAPERWSLECGIGSGITIDAGAAGEAREWQAKQRFLERAPRPFELLETVLLDGGRIWLMDEHLARLAASAAALGFVCEPEVMRDMLEAAAQVAPGGQYRLRLLLRPDGAASIEAHPLTPLPAEHDAQGRARATLAATPIDSLGRAGEFVRHKTTHRAIYAPFEPPAGCVDTLMWNARGELTEFTRGNLALHVDGIWATPDLRSGLLPGTYRAALLAQGRLAERVLRLEDLLRADEAAFVNGVRGWLAVQIEPLREQARALLARRG